MTTENKKRKVNFIDIIFLIILAAVCIFAVVGLNGASEKSAPVQNKVVLTLELKEVQPEILANIEQGQVVYDAVSKEQVGTIFSINHKPHQILVENHTDKKLEYKDASNKVDVNVEIDALATVTGSDIMVSQSAVKIGKSISYFTQNTMMSGTIIGIELDETSIDKESGTK